MPVAPKAASDRSQTGLSWPLRPKRSLEQQPTHRQSWTGQVPAQQKVLEQGKADGKPCQGEHVGEQSVWRETCQQQRDVSSSQELSPGAKEALVLAGLLSEEQVCLLP